MRIKEETGIAAGIIMLFILVIGFMIYMMILTTNATNERNNNTFEYGKSGEWYRDNHIKITINKEISDEEIKQLLEKFLELRRKNQ